MSGLFNVYERLRKAYAVACPIVYAGPLPEHERERVINHCKIETGE